MLADWWTKAGAACRPAFPSRCNIVKLCRLELDIRGPEWYASADTYIEFVD
jgi:hypothetical protein